MLRALVDLVLPQACAGCRAKGAGLCGECRTVLQGPPLGWTAPTPCPAGMPPVAAFAPYDGAVKRLLLQHKEQARLDLTQPLGEALAGAAALLGSGPLLLCPVPSSRSAVRARGHDHAWRLAATAAGALVRRGRQARAERVLVPVRRTADQAGLSSAERAANLRGALTARSPRGEELVVVVDDVVTTGATLVEATRALGAAGHVVLGAAVVAATRRARSRASSGIPLHPAAERR